MFPFNPNKSAEENFDTTQEFHEHIVQDELAQMKKSFKPNSSQSPIISTKPTPSTSVEIFEATPSPSTSAVTFKLNGRISDIIIYKKKFKPVTKKRKINRKEQSEIWI